MVNVNGDGNVKMSNASPINDVNMIRRKMKNIYANMTGCKMNDVRLKLQYKQNSNGCRTTKTGCSKNRLGGGAYGTAYKAYANNGKTVPLVVKESTKQNKDDQESKIEHDTIKVLRNAGFSENIPRVYGYKICDKNEYLFSDLVKGVALKDFRPTSKDQLASIVTQILYTLYKINKKIPSFRHHDLHQDNVMIVKDEVKDLIINDGQGRNYKFNNGGVKAVIIDFGLAYIAPNDANKYLNGGAVNPKVRNGNYNHSGIGPKSSPMYDAHFFLYCVYALINPNNRSRMRPATNITNVNKKKEIEESMTRVRQYIEKQFESRFLNMVDTTIITGGRLTFKGQKGVKTNLLKLIQDINLIPVDTPPGSNTRTILPQPRQGNQLPTVNQTNMKKLYKNLVAHQAKGRGSTRLGGTLVR